jgi:hypothetical protein
MSFRKNQITTLGETYGEYPSYLFFNRTLLNIYNKNYLIVLFFSACLNLSGQLPDGVSATWSYLDLIISNYNNENASSFDIDNVSISARIPLRVHIIMNVNG